MNTVLVGNGPSATQRKNGHIIDQFETVVRFNVFHIDGFEEFVGTKTDIWAVNIGFPQGRIKWNGPGPRPRTVIYVPYTTSFDYPGSTYEVISKLPLDGAVMCPPLIARIADLFYDGETWASTGLTAMLHLMPCFVTGFDSFNSSKHHYGDDHVPSRIYHNPQREAEVVHKLIKSGHLAIL